MREKDQRRRSEKVKAHKSSDPRPRGAKWDFTDSWNVMSRVNRRMNSKIKRIKARRP